MAIDFPNSPNNGDSFTSNDKTWQYNGTSWVVIAGSVSIDAGSVTASKLANNAVTSDKIAAGAVTAAKLGNDISLTPPDGSVTQAKLAASLSGVTVTTTANRSTAVPSPFTGQLVFLTDVTRLQVWNGSAWTFITNGAPGAPTSLSATALSTTSVSVAFTIGTINGASPTNYKYSLSTNGGSTYGEPTALDPADTTSPVVISGLTASTTYHIKLRAVSDFGDSVDSSPVSVTTPASLNVEYLVIAGGGGGGGDVGGGGGAGGLLASSFVPTLSTTYSANIGGGGAGHASTLRGTSGSDSQFASLTTSTGGGGGGGGSATSGLAGGSGGGGARSGGAGGARTASPIQGQNGGTQSGTSLAGAGGGGATVAGFVNGNQIGGNGGNGSNAYSDWGSAVNLGQNISGTYWFAGGGGGGSYPLSTLSNGGNGGGAKGGGGDGSNSPVTVAASALSNTGGGGGGGRGDAGAGSTAGGAGGSGVIILRYPSFYTITVGAGLTASAINTVSGIYKYTALTAGSGNVSWA